MIIKDEGLMKLDLKVLCAAAIAFLRKVHNISPAWNDELVIISGGLAMQDIESTLETLQSKYQMTHFGLQHIQPG
jgi:hypothetical protein